jgi:hypothetical protein
VSESLSYLRSDNTITKEPEHGTATIDVSEHFPNFSKDNVRAKCNDKKVRGPVLLYKAATGYVGTDTLEVLSISSKWIRNRVRPHDQDNRGEETMMTWIKIVCVLSFALLFVRVVSAEAQTRIYDARGNSIGTAAPQGQGSIRYYDPRGNSLGTSSTTPGETTTFYGPSGNVTGRASGPAFSGNPPNR